jgi:ABC-2 type transport system permease protein
MLRRLALMYPAMLRVGFASALAYRAEFFVWVLTTNLPLINLALWTAVARDAPVGRYGQAEFAAYFLAALVVRLLTGCWVVWELTMDIRQGTLAMRLLRPVHPLIAYSAENLAALPMRVIVSLPIAIILLVTVGPRQLTHDPLAWVAIPVMILGAWMMTFLVMALVGSLALFVESASSLYEVWLGLFTVFSGYLVPLELFPAWLRDIARVLPFRLMLGLPVEAMLGHLTRAEMAEGLLFQLAYIAGLAVVLRFVWNAGLRRFAAFGG